MAWARVDDAWWCHPKVLTLDLDARGLWVSVLSWSCQQRTDRIPEQIVRMCGDDGTAAAKLVAAGLWDEHDAGWSVHDWNDYQSESARKAEAGRKGGRKSGESRRAAAEAKQDDEADEGASREAEQGASDEAGPSLPVPTQPSPKKPKKVGASGSDDPKFEEFWQGYPRRDGMPGGGATRKEAWKSWQRVPDDQHDAILTAIKFYADYVVQPGAPHVAHATTWLNQERWEQFQEPRFVKPRDGPKGPVRPPDGDVDYTAGWGAA